MSGSRRFEWSRRFPAGPTDWMILDHADACETAAQAPGWFMPRLNIVDQGNHVFSECRFHKWCGEEPGVALYDAEEMDFAAWVNYPAGQVYVQEVPPPLVVTCSLTRIEEGCFEAVFTTMAGERILHIPRTSNLSASMEELAIDAAIAAVGQGRLQSRNRQVYALCWKARPSRWAPCPFQISGGTG